MPNSKPSKRRLERWCMLWSWIWIQRIIRNLSWPHKLKSFSTSTSTCRKSSSYTPCLSISLLLMTVLWSSEFTLPLVECFGMSDMSPRVVFTKQGPIQGYLGPTTAGVYHLPHLSGGSNFNIRQYSGRPIVEIFRGIPYASAPTGSLRYESPAPVPLRSRTEVYHANVTRPACPRTSEEVLNRTSYPESPFRALKKTLDIVEDCLYLDVYAPINKVYHNTGDKNRGEGLAVLVYMNSHPDDPQNPFDGSSMTAIGHIIVISVRYRTGVLGFLQPSYSEDVRSNFGLWDQIAALQWIQENIAEFGGDPNNISLMGYDIDATVAGLLALSPVSQAYNGLFHRLILLNGSPFAPNAINSEPIRTTYQLARALPCPTDERTGDLTKCLRSMPLPRLINAAEKNIGAPMLTYPFSPVADGIIVPHEVNQPSPGNAPAVKEMLRKYDILCGLKEGPVLPKLGSHSFNNIDMDRFITAVIKLTMKMESGSQPTQDVKRAILNAIVQDQGYGTSPPMRELISDFLIVQPIIDLLNAHAKTGKNTFFYVLKDYDPLLLKKNDEISYIFSSNVYKWKFIGTPSHSHNLHPFVVLINLISNFVRNGDPNIMDPSDRFPNPVKSWPKYTEDYGRYMEISDDVQFPSGYRKSSTNFWGKSFLSIIKSFSNKSSDPNTNLEFPPFPRNYNNNYGNVNLRDKNDFGLPNNKLDGDATDSKGPIIAGGQSTVVLVGCLLLLLNFLCFMGLFYQKERLKKAEIQLRKRYIQTQNQLANSHPEAQDIEIECNSSLAERCPPSHNHNHPHLHHQQHDHTHLPMQRDLRDNMSETETENGFGPDFLGPNYDPRTKVNRWMQMQHQNQNHNRILAKGHSFDEYSNPTPTPSDLMNMNRDRDRHRLSRVREDDQFENMYETAPNPPQMYKNPMTTPPPPPPPVPSHGHGHGPHILNLGQLPSYMTPQQAQAVGIHPHPQQGPIPPPLQIQINSLQRQKNRQGQGPPKAQPELPVQFIPQLPYQEPFKLVGAMGSDIPYADSRATSPSVISAPAGFSSQTRPSSNFSNGNKFGPNSNENPQSSASTKPTNSVNPNSNPITMSNKPKPNLNSTNTTTPTYSPGSKHSNSNSNSNSTESPKSTSILVTGPKRSSTLIVRDLDPPDIDCEPKYVAVKTGTLKRSVGVDTDHDTSPSIGNVTGDPGNGDGEIGQRSNPSQVRVTFKENV